jgi:alpha,alpha-trehalase
MYAKDYKDCLDYIDKYWDRIIFKASPMKLPYALGKFRPPFLKKQAESKNFISIPHYYFVSNDKKFKYIFYWDSYFMFQGLTGTKREWLMKNQVENLMYLFRKFDIIPNFGAPASMGRSQPPFLSSMIFEVYQSQLRKLDLMPFYKKAGVRIGKRNLKKWLRNTFNLAKLEYEKVWIDKERIYNHSVDNIQLSRYGDRDIGYAQSSELESGWDLTSRFYNRCDQFLPVDLNSYLYKYELDFAAFSNILGDSEEELSWKKKAGERKKTMISYMFNKKEKFFFDYRYSHKEISAFLSLAGFTPMWAGMISQKQAEEMRKKLSKFETPYGLAVTAKESLAKPIDLSKIGKFYHAAVEEIIKPKQWDYPNIWPPLEFLTVIGLLKYGFVKDAKRIMENSVKIHASLYRKYNTFFEKINGETGKPAASFHYKSQEGFGWTNAIFYRYIQLLDTL